MRDRQKTNVTIRLQASACSRMTKSKYRSTKRDECSAYFDALRLCDTRGVALNGARTVLPSETNGRG